MVRGAAVAAAVWGLLFLLYVILISAVPPLELMAGAGFALLGAVAAEAIRRAEHPALRGSHRLASATAAFPRTLLRETAELASAAAVAAVAAVRGPHSRRDPGTVVTIRLPPDVDAACAAALLSASPGACVIDISNGGGPAGARGTRRGPGPEDFPGTAEGWGSSDVASADGGARGGCELTVRLLRPAGVSAVERALGGRRSV